MNAVWKLRNKEAKSWKKCAECRGKKMPKSLTKKENLPLPYNWEVRQDYDGKIYYIDHTKKLTTWIDPRDR